MTEKRLTHLYWGYGKGKTTAVMGLALRALGTGWKVLIVQFLKESASGEVRMLEDLGVPVFRCTHSDRFVFQMDEEEKIRTRASHEQALKQAIDMVHKEKVDMLILDEAGSACETEMLDREMLKAFVNQKPEHLELVMTAHKLEDWMYEAADYVTHMEMQKHPYNQGILARDGVDF